ncbi:hypothetical protein LMG28614_02454 [Paraburkholderia ultramafica]|uniref:HTH cro/C1-type domain-containing protein n=1 Tax=Paraburkholderia ultramafica TaxID=1544867 RepID=A0A6S7CDQ0_9BURK|nr:XRE family transcriptional regulator [Paraburkholderia ultramafica]CAB3787233.1 hypothetical protein LMG28614_02454 [Paraburkholderia ultramafica]
MVRRANLEVHLDRNRASSNWRRAFAAKLDMTMKRAKLSAFAVASSVGVTERDVVLWRAGASAPESLGECERLSAALRVDLDWLCAV